MVDQADRSVFLRGFRELLVRLNNDARAPQKAYIPLFVGGDRKLDLQQTIKCAELSLLEV